jgi:cyclic pyranopterin phosphate synthase
MMPGLSHLDSRGQAAMVDVAEKEITRRYARAWGRLRLEPETLAAITSGGVAKGDVFAAARLAGIMAAKRCGELIPLCHPLPLDWAGVELVPLPAAGPQEPARIIIIGEAGLAGRTGVEMEALTAVSVAGLTVYDMCKAVDRGLSLEKIALLEKRGGRSGHYWDRSVSAILDGADECELELGERVFCRVREAALEFSLRPSEGPELGRLAGLSAGPGALAGGLLVLGSALLIPLPAAGEGWLEVVKPGRLGPGVLGALLG